MKMKIQFKARKHIYESISNKPIPAMKAIPDWYKKMPSYSGDQYQNKERLNMYSNFGSLQTGMTIKKCLPVRDMITAGYIIPLWAEIAVESDKEKDILQFNWLYNEELIQSHKGFQVKDSPIEKMARSDLLFKLINPWHIYTPPGYSSLIISPSYHENNPIRILPGIVDTDEYHEVNFPFEYNGPDGKSIIKMDTPIAQVIPFKREEWNLTNEILDEDEFRRKEDNFSRYLGGLYKKLFHKKKIFR
jgi:hypothetical protein